MIPSGKTTMSRREALASGAALLGVTACARTAQATGNRLGPADPTQYRFELGDFEITTILDAGAYIDGPWPIVGEDRPREDVEKLMQAHLLPPRKFRPGFTPTVVNTGAEIILFDTGNGADGFIPRPAGGWLAQRLRPAGFAPEQIDIVVLTHCHPDHIGGLVEASKPLLPNARYVLGRAEDVFWSRPERMSAAAKSLELQTARLFRRNVQPFREKTTFIEPGQEVVHGIRAVEAYGHTPGHLAFHIESGGRQLLLWGDCAHHEVASLAEPGWHALFDMDKAQGAATRKRVYDMAANDRLPVIGYHTTFPSVGFVERAGSAYRWIPNSYQLGL